MQAFGRRVRVRIVGAQNINVDLHVKRLVAIMVQPKGFASRVPFIAHDREF